MIGLCLIQVYFQLAYVLLLINEMYKMIKPLIVTSFISGVTFNVLAFLKIIIITWSIKVAFLGYAIDVDIPILIFPFLVQNCSLYLIHLLHWMIVSVTVPL